MADRNATQRWWRQPLLHFLVAGAAIFLWSSVFGNKAPASRDKIVISGAQIERLSSLWVQTWGRQPTPDELDGLVQDFISEEVYYRQAIALGLDVNDPVIRRRLRQKMEFMVIDAIDTSNPPEEVLRGYFADNSDRYAIGPSYTFEQIALGSDVDDPGSLLARLNRGDSITHSDVSPRLPRYMSKADNAEIARTFGTVFFEALASLEVDLWSGPVPSGFGQHVVKLSQKTSSQRPDFEAVRDRVLVDWASDARTANQQEQLERLKQNYTIEIDDTASE